MFMRNSLLIAATILLVSGSAATAGDIHQAIRAGDLDQVKTLIDSDRSLVNRPDGENPFRYLPIHTAAESGQDEIARYLLEMGADLEAFDSDQSTPLHVAAVKGRREMVNLFLAKGADVNRRDRNGAYGLSFAASGGDSAIVQSMLDAGADLNFKNQHGVTLLHMAASRGLDEFVDLLVAEGADVNAVTDEAITPLHWTALSTHVDMVKRLIDLGANPSLPDSTGETPLMKAAWRGRLEVAEALIARGADPDAISRHGYSPLLVAARRGDHELIKLLVQHDVEIDRQDQEGNSALMLATRSGSAAAVGELIDAGADLGLSENHYGFTPLHKAALKGYADVAEALLDGGAAIDATDKMGRRPRALASRYGHADLARLLASRGATGGKLVSATEGGLDAQRRGLRDSEAVIWYLEHSGWAIKTRNHLLVFDYSPPERAPDQPGLATGHIDPAELGGENVTVFASHGHGDHYDARILDWREQLPDITYVFGFHPDQVEGYEYVGPREERRALGGLRITSIESNDSGVGFVVEVDGLTVFHAGDHANRQRDFSGPYKAEIDYLAASGTRPDIAFMPISGCGFGDQVAVKMGVEYALETLRPRVFIPMHGGSAGYRYVEFIDETGDKHPDVQMVAFEQRGDHFRYGDGRMDLTAGGAD